MGLLLQIGAFSQVKAAFVRSSLTIPSRGDAGINLAKPESLWFYPGGSDPNMILRGQRRIIPPALLPSCIP
ncbi:MAG: hypothetical protein CL389_08090 [Acidiferrobacteraceae bacterium]|nr:hypothetical protein [Acidiferrobacteraceae bacterium]